MELRDDVSHAFSFLSANLVVDETSSSKCLFSGFSDESYLARVVRPAHRDSVTLDLLYEAQVECRFGSLEQSVEFFTPRDATDVDLDPAESRSNSERSPSFRMRRRVTPS